MERLEKLKKDGVIPEGAALYDDYEKMISDSVCDAVAITTPHTSHLKIAETAFKNKLHVMCDKPITVTVSEADQMLNAWRESGTKFSTMFVMRTSHINKTVKKYIDDGKLGKIRRADMVCTKWLRTQKYFDCQAWRGTWNGEGGGLLMNQAPHNLDLLFWWFGDAENVQAEVARRFHKIETEDEVNALVNTKAGFPVRFYANTAEAPGVDRIEIVGEKGTLIRENGKLRFEALKENLEEVVKHSEEPFATIESVSEELNIPEDKQGHKAVFESFIENIISGEPNNKMASPGDEGIHSVEWANSILLSSLNKQKITLPLDRDKYEELLNSLKDGKTKLA
jgi:predicted dehydrogenase